MSITLTPDLERFVQKEVATGRYSTPDEAVCSAVRFMREQRLAELRDAIDLADAQVAAGRCTTLNSDEELGRFMEEIKVEGRRHLQAEQAG
ncbi:MAG: type II toxin-antitoxin system ParD family antitoxin [Planctomycetales bacterium]|nr:type II toxin-antitoxin system ParD family antitoxin [Planctomycetales bacterium]